jgi:CheY-like chemotaxis protein
MSAIKNVFLVEDDPDDRGFFIEALSNIQNAKLCGVARNGKEALNELIHSVVIPDTIFMDINMPLMNGIECLRALINIPRISHIPVVMLSTAVEQAEFCCRLDAKGYIKKPNDVAVLQAELTQVINREFIVCNSLNIKPYSFNYKQHSIKHVKTKDWSYRPGDQRPRTYNVGTCYARQPFECYATGCSHVV